MNSFLENIVYNVKQRTSIEKAVYLARIDDEGRILMPVETNSNEFVWAGISDVDSNYLYIRHRDSGSIFYEESPDARIKSCGHSKTITRYELRLVACMKNWCSYNLEAELRSALLTTKFVNTSNMTSARVILRESCIDSMQVVKDESPKPKQFNKNLIFVSIDFDLEFVVNYF
jgi:hypothetical protein